MSNSLEVFESTLQKTHLWLKEIMEDLKTHDRHRAYLVLRATLHALRDRLGVEEVAKLGAQLPMLVRGFYYEGWDPTGKPLKERHKENFLAHVYRALKTNALLEPDVDPEEAARAVFKLLTHRLTDGEIGNVLKLLPKEIRELWPEESRASTQRAVRKST